MVDSCWFPIKEWKVSAISGLSNRLGTGTSQELTSNQSSVPLRLGGLVAQAPGSLGELTRSGHLRIHSWGPERNISETSERNMDPHWLPYPWHPMTHPGVSQYPWLGTILTMISHTIIVTINNSITLIYIKLHRYGHLHWASLTITMTHYEPSIVNSLAIKLAIKH